LALPSSIFFSSSSNSSLAFSFHHDENRQRPGWPKAPVFFLCAALMLFQGYHWPVRTGRLMYISIQFFLYKKGDVLNRRIFQKVIDSEILFQEQQYSSKRFNQKSWGATARPFSRQDLALSLSPKYKFNKKIPWMQLMSEGSSWFLLKILFRFFQFPLKPHFCPAKIEYAKARFDQAVMLYLTVV